MVYRQFVPVFTHGKIIAVNFADDFQKKDQDGRKNDPAGACAS